MLVECVVMYNSLFVTFVGCIEYMQITPERSSLW
jgi:hypothetical protein